MVIVKILFGLLLELGRFTIGFGDESLASVAICVSGHLSRLELKSKLRYLVLPNKVQGHEISVFISLFKNDSTLESDFPSQYSPHVKKKRDISISFHGALGTLKVLPFEKSVWRYKGEIFENIRQYSAFSDELGSRQHYDVVVDIREVPEIPLEPTVSLFGEKSQSAKRVRRSHRLLVQYHARHRCMSLIEEYEMSIKKRFKWIVSMRDDSVLLGDWLLSPRINTMESDEKRHPSKMVKRSIFYGLSCMGSPVHGRLAPHGEVFLLSRLGADCFLKGLIMNYHLHRYRVQAWKIQNPNMYVGHVAQLCFGAMHTLSLCEAPILSMSYLPFDKDSTSSSNRSSDSNSHSVWPMQLKGETYTKLITDSNMDTCFPSRSQTSSESILPLAATLSPSSYGDCRAIKTALEHLIKRMQPVKRATGTWIDSNPKTNIVTELVDL